MKRFITLLTVAILFSSNPSLAQSPGSKITYGIKAGVNAAYFGLSSEYKKEMKEDGFTNIPVVSFHLGGYADYTITEAFSLQAGLLLTGKGSKELWSGEDDFEDFYYEGSFKENLMYLEIPVNAVYKKGRFYFGAGPYAGYALSGKWKEKYEEDYGDGDIENAAESGKIVFSGENAYRKRFDFGVNLLAGYQLSKKLSLGANFGLGLLNLNKSEYSNSDEKAYWAIKNRVFSISVGYSFLK